MLQQIPKARQQRLIALAKQLHVTHKQAKQLFPIMKAQEPQLQAIRNNPSLSRAEKPDRLHEVQDASNPQVKAILTPAQFQQLQVIRHPAHGAYRGSKGRPQIIRARRIRSIEEHPH